MTTMYGWFNGKEDLGRMAISVCNVLGHGVHGRAPDQIMETMAAESGLGTIKDRTVKAGMGITQFDRRNFEEVQRRSMKHRDLILEKTGIDIALVEWEHLRYSPYLCILFTRLHYKLIPQQIPRSRAERAAYWKQFYNSVAGKGTVAHYMESAAAFLGEEA